jgi:hypothetical protein
MTLIELIVAVGVMAVMIIGFSSILAQSQKLVYSAEETMRANAAAASIELVIREDMLRVTQNGFLAIGSANGYPALAMAAPAVSRSLVGAATGTGSILTYGLCSNTAADPAQRVLYRKAWVLKMRSADESSATLDEDRWDLDFGQLQMQSAAAVQTTVSQAFTDAPQQVTVPVTTVSQIAALWQVLAADCTQLSFAYLSGGASGTSAWQSGSRTWTRQDPPGSWPSAIKISFVLSDPTLPAEFRDHAYEVICPVAQ